MNNFYSFVFAIFISFNLFSQKETFAIPLIYKSKSYNNKEAVAISNTKNGELVILVEDNKDTKLQLIDADGNLKEQLSAKKLGYSFANFLGHHYFNDGTYAIIFSDNRKVKFSALKFNFRTKKIEQVLLDFKYTKEKYVESITQNNVFYLLTSNKGKSNDVNFYELNNDNSFKKHVVSFKSISSVSPNGNKKYPIDVLTARVFGSGSLTKIDPNSPNSIQTTSGANKLYQSGDELLFSFDKEKDTTKIIRLNLKDFSLRVLKIEKPNLEKNEGDLSYALRHNSYIKDSIIFHVAVSRKQMKFVARNIDTKEVLKEIYIKQDDSITFKNGPIISEKTGDAAMFSAKERKLEKTSKFLRKISTANTGITAISIADNMQLTIGGYVEMQSSAGAMAGSFGALGAATYVLANAAFNPTYSAYSSYSSTKMTYINCIFDKDFNHLQDEIKDNVFDVIQKYEVEFDYQERVVKQEENGSKYVTPARMRLKNVFYHNGNHYLGYLNSMDRNYHLVKF